MNTHMNTSGGTASPNTTPGMIRRPTLRCTAPTSCSPTALSRSTSRSRNKCRCSRNPPRRPRRFLRADPGQWSKCGGEVDFDELAGESEPGHAQQRARGGERRSDDRKGELAPGCGQNLVVIADDVD